jgi:hypothetical protein
MAQPDKVVRLTLKTNGMPVPDQDPVLVTKGDQKVKWSADFPFTIDIDNYAEKLNYGPGDDDGPHNCKSGVFDKKHKYSITANGHTNDPDIDIKP